MEVSGKLPMILAVRNSAQECLASALNGRIAKRGDQILVAFWSYFTKVTGMSTISQQPCLSGLTRQGSRLAVHSPVDLSEHDFHGTDDGDHIGNHVAPRHLIHRG